MTAAGRATASRSIVTSASTKSELPHNCLLALADSACRHQKPRPSTCSRMCFSSSFFILINGLEAIHNPDLEIP